jgi:signal transduction histidine kinase
MSDRPIQVFGDDDRLKQVVTNLIDNALKYSPESEPVEIDVALTGRTLTLTVQDRGIGVPPRELEQIFDPFGRASNAAAAEVPGLGLGLYICRTIVERHDGTISATSSGPGSGLRVTVRLPALVDASAID